MTSTLDKALEELKRLPEDTQAAIVHDLLEMIRSEARWDRQFADPRSAAVLKRLADEAARDETFDFDPATRPALKATG